MRRTVPPSAEIEAQIDQLLAVGVGENPREALSELAKLGARLIIQRAVEDEFDAWLGRARYERRPDADLAAAWAAPTTFPRRSGSWSPALTPSQSAASSSARRPPREGCDCPSAPTTSASAATRSWTWAPSPGRCSP